MKPGYRWAGLLGCTVLSLVIACKSASVVMNLPAQESAPAVTATAQPASSTAESADSAPGNRAPSLSHRTSYSACG